MGPESRSSETNSRVWRRTADGNFFFRLSLVSDAAVKKYSSIEPLDAPASGASATAVVHTCVKPVWQTLVQRQLRLPGLCSCPAPKAGRGVSMIDRVAADHSDGRGPRLPRHVRRVNASMADLCFCPAL